MVKVLFLLLFLTSCASFRVPEPTIITKEKLIYILMPEIRAPSPIPTEIPQLDYPRGDKLIVKNSKDCKGVIERTEGFWKRCGILEVDYASNIYMGFDKDNFNKFNSMLINAKARETLWKALIERINIGIRLHNEQSIRE